MKIINNCFVLNKEEADKILPILVDELEFNCMMLSAHLKKVQELKPETVEYTRKRIETLMPFFCDYMNNEGTLSDHECKQMKNMSIEMFAEYMYERQKGGQK